MASEILSVEQRKALINAQLEQFAGEAFLHALAMRRAEARLHELSEDDPDRPTFTEALDRARRDLETLNSAITVNRQALSDLTG